MPNQKILIVDDELAIRRGLRGLIDWGSYGFEVVKEAADGLEAWEWLADHPVDLIITDIKMPAMDGLELAKRVSESLPQVEVAILSGYDDFRFAQQAIRYHAQRYLLKPVEPEELIELLEKLKAKKNCPDRNLSPQEPTRDPQPMVFQSRGGKMVEEMKRWIESDLGEEHSLRSLGEKFFVNPAYLGQLFRQCTGQHFSDYLNERRVMKAKELLTVTDLLVYEIMERVGFHDASYFGKQFRRFIGMTPQEYRTQLSRK